MKIFNELLTSALILGNLAAFNLGSLIAADVTALEKGFQEATQAVEGTTGKIAQNLQGQVQQGASIESLQARADALKDTAGDWAPAKKPTLMDHISSFGTSIKNAFSSAGSTIKGWFTSSK